MQELFQQFRYRRLRKVIRQLYLSCFELNARSVSNRIFEFDCVECILIALRLICRCLFTGINSARRFFASKTEITIIVENAKPIFVSYSLVVYALSISIISPIDNSISQKAHVFDQNTRYNVALIY